MAERAEESHAAILEALGFVKFMPDRDPKLPEQPNADANPAIRRLPAD